MKLANWTSATAIALCTVLTLLLAGPAQTQTFTVLHDFTGPDGAQPHGALLLDPAGNLYGVTMKGGAQNTGTVFKLDTAGNESVVYSFGGQSGGRPNAGLVRDAAGNFYGTTTFSYTCQAVYGCGNVFKMDPAGNVTVLHTFGGSSSDGANPVGPVVLDSAGNLFGATFTGGGTRCQRDGAGGKLVIVGCGTLFKIDANGQESVLHAFGITDGAYPSAGLVQDTAGNLFGTAYQGGLENCKFSGLGCGTVFKVDTTGQFSVLYSLQGGELGPDGAYPLGTVTLDPAGTLYATTSSGGAPQPACPSVPQGGSCGTIFQLTPAGKEAVLYSFKGLLGIPGGPGAGMVRDAAGNLYGFAGGAIFKLDSTGQLSVLFTLTGYPDDATSDDLALDANGNLYGLSPNGATGFGNVFKLTTPPDFAIGALALAPATVAAGSSATAALDVITVSGFNDTLKFACSVSPQPAQGPQCSISTGTPARVTVTTSGPSARGTSSSGGSRAYALWLPLLGLVGIGSLGSKQRRIKTMLLGCVLCLGIASQVACGGGGSSGGHPVTPAGAYTITVTGTSSAATGSLVRSTKTTLTVQ